MPLPCDVTVASSDAPFCLSAVRKTSRLLPAPVCSRLPTHSPPLAEASVELASHAPATVAADGAAGESAQAVTSAHTPTTKMA